MRPNFLLVLAALFVAFILLMSSAYTVGEQEQVIITQFGKPVGGPINSDPEKNEAGLHFKTPFVQEVNRFEKRILEWDGPSAAMSTREKQTIVVDAFARWRISDPLKYFLGLRDERSALSRLNDTVGTAVRSVIAAHDLVEVVRTDKSRTAPKPDLDLPIPAAPGAPSLPAPLNIATSTPGVLPKIQFGRVELEKQVLDQATAAIGDRWGIQILDVRFKRINYNPSVADKIHERMISERTQIAESFRSAGAGEAAKIDGRRGKELQQIESEAYRTVQELKGKADAEATSIYAQAYNTGPAAADFYQFLKTLETYKTTLGQDSTLIMTTDSDFFKYLKRIDPKTAPAPAPAPAAP